MTGCHSVVQRLFGATLLLSTASASAQTSAAVDRGYLIVHGGVQLPPADVTGIARPIDFAEASIVNTTYKRNLAPNVEVGGGVRVWRNLAIGATASWTSKAGAAAVDAQVPHPFFFGRPRQVSGDASGLAHTETALHVQARWRFPATLNGRWQVDLAGGPSLFFIDQDLVQDVTITQTYPFDSATYAGVVPVHRARSSLGFHLGADVTHRVGPHAGLGFDIGFSHASAALSTPDGGTVSVNEGGVHIAASLRVAISRKGARPRR
jgi:Outer membrane protein beta-barrel domain